MLVEQQEAVEVEVAAAVEVQLMLQEAQDSAPILRCHHNRVVAEVRL